MGDVKNLIMHIVGNRPQFIKLAPVSRELRKRGYKEIIVHTGQHFDDRMSGMFFRELDIPEPNQNLHVSGGSHSEMTARMMLKLEDVVIKYHPQVVYVYGDTNSTLAAALVVRKLNIPIIHVEAGTRTGIYENPEEVNRVFVDHASQLLCAPDRNSFYNLEREGLGEKSYFTGDVMCDAYYYYKDKIDAKAMISRYEVKEKEYILMTWHRQENTSEMEKMRQILEFIADIKKTIVCPMHPRTYKKLEEYGLLSEAKAIDGFHIIEPVGYLEMIALSSNSSLIITDSGGLSKESYFAGVRCAYMLDMSVWTDLESIGWIKRLTGNNKNDISMINDMLDFQSWENRSSNETFYGDGNAARKIVDLMEKNILSL